MIKRSKTDEEQIDKCMEERRVRSEMNRASMIESLNKYELKGESE